ncbi:MAG: hypothetical protein C4334_01185 [Pyrinomonas sp.]|uniref:hypothetical protein n=1 Tax=Pyrinomonas sp. TaxID=2080306 RepID=UPI003322D209
MDKKSKYDTDPLEPDYARRTEEVWGRATEDAEVEAATRRYVEFPPSGSSVTSAPPPQPFATTPIGVADGHLSSSRCVAGLGIAEKVAMALPYAPFYIGAAFAIVELFIAPRKEARVRLNAAQALALHVAIMAGGLLFRFSRFLAGLTLGEFSVFLVNIAWLAYQVVALIFLISLLIKSWRGEEVKLEPLDRISKRINQLVDPRNG